MARKTSQNLSVIFGPDVNLADYYIFENIIQNIVVGVRWSVKLVICDIFTQTNIPVDWHHNAKLFLRWLVALIKTKQSCHQYRILAMCKFGTSQQLALFRLSVSAFWHWCIKNHFFCFTALRSRLNAVSGHIKSLEILHAKPITKILTCHKTRRCWNRNLAHFSYRHLTDFGHFFTEIVSPMWQAKATKVSSMSAFLLHFWGQFLLTDCRVKSLKVQ